MALRAVTPSTPDQLPELPVWATSLLRDGAALVGRLGEDRAVRDAWERFTPAVADLWRALQPRLMPQLLSVLSASVFRR